MCRFSFYYVLVAMGLVVPGAAKIVDEIAFEPHSVKLPYPVSDIMATYVGGGATGSDDDSGFIIITGGCDSVKGNERSSWDENLFVCMSTSNRTLRFDPFSDKVTEVAPAPHARQRHAAVVVDGIEVWVVGGRDTDDNLVTAIDSYNTQTNTWTTRGYLPDEVVTSDLTAWTWKSYIYVSGGFVYNYTAVGTTYRMDTTTKDLDIVGSIQEVATSPHPRGDFHAVVYDGYAYLAGGITHVGFWCDGLKTTQRYHMESDTWEDLSDLLVGRADMAVALLNGKVTAIGGEVKPEDCIQISDPAYGSFPVNHVEVLLNPTSLAEDTEWVDLGDFHDERFRFAATVVSAQNRLYTFGGQLPFDFTCDCFPTSDLIGVGTEVFAEDDDDTNAGMIAAVVLGAVGSLVVFVLVVWKFMQKRNKESLEKANPVEFKENEQQDME